MYNVVKYNLEERRQVGKFLWNTYWEIIFIDVFQFVVDAIYVGVYQFFFLDKEPSSPFNVDRVPSGRDNDKAQV
jgi:hypothetical protein